METLQLSEPEQRYYSDLFLLCSINPDNSSSVPIIKACELFRTSKLPNDVLRQITDVCSCSKSSELFRKEFYMALKLIAAAQAGLVVSTEAVSNGMEVPLPRFTWPSDEPSDLIQLTEVAAVTSAGKTSPSASSTASDSPTPTNSVQDKVWAATTAWQGIVCEEQRQLLGTEEESSDRHSSSEEGGDGGESVLTMTDEQRAYYTQQFHTLQPKSNHTLPGPAARLFFEKSRLPVHELRQIWQLADVTKDGALSLEEFNIAMHLVVLRRNDVPLPESLPASLMPLQPAASHPATPVRSTTHSSQSKTSNKQWTKFVDSPTSSIASPGPKPVNFDFHKSAVEQDPKIFHPVAVRVTPEQLNGVPPVENDHEVTRSEGDGGGATKRVLLQSYSADSGGGDVIRPIQRPTPRKPHPHPQPGALPPPPHSAIDDASGPTSLPVMGPKKEPPPPPPPRPYRTHGRSSSLDLNRIGRSASLHAPPAPPPRGSPNSTSPHKLPCEEESVTGSEAAPRRQGAFHVYRKSNKTEAEVIETEPEADYLKSLEVQKAGLSQLCQQMQQELLSLQEERCLLQAKLDQLHATYDT